MDTSGLKDAISQIAQLAVGGVNPTLVNQEVDDGKARVMMPMVAIAHDKNGQVQTVGLLAYLEAAQALAEKLRLSKAVGPDVRSGDAHLQALSSFIAHAKRFRAEYSAIWADAEGRQLVSVLDYHEPGATGTPRWGKHSGIYSCPLSEAWQAWGGGRALELSQDDFATLLDARDRELAPGKLPNGNTAPDPAYLVTLAANLEVYSGKNTKRERDPNTGRVKISFSEESGVLGAVMPPAAFLIQIPVFQDLPPIPLEVRLRVTVEDGEATFTVQIHAATDVLRQAFEEICSRVGAETGMPVFIGVPEMHEDEE